MLLGAFAVGILAAGMSAVCCIRARDGVAWAQTACRIGVSAFFALASLGLLLALVLMLTGCKENCTEQDGWWTAGQGQQFLAAALGWVSIAGAARSVREHLYSSAAILVFAAVVLFALWGLLLEAGWSDRGPLAVVPLLL